MKQDEAIEQLLDLAKEGRDQEDSWYATQDADHVLCEFLVALGYQDLVDAYWQVPKSYGESEDD